MSANELDTFLARTLDAVIGINRPDGGPQLSVIWYAWDGERFLLSIYGGSAKHRNLRRDPNVTLLVNDPIEGRYVVAYGRAALIEPITLEHRLQLLRRYVPADEIGPWIERGPTEQQVGVILRPERLIVDGK